MLLSACCSSSTRVVTAVSRVHWEATESLLRVKVLMSPFPFHVCACYFAITDVIASSKSSSLTQSSGSGGDGLHQSHAIMPQFHLQLTIVPLYPLMSQLLQRNQGTATPVPTPLPQQQLSVVPRSE